MKRAIQVTAGAAVCFGLGSYWSAANSQLDLLLAHILE